MFAVTSPAAMTRASSWMGISDRGAAAAVVNGWRGIQSSERRGFTYRDIFGVRRCSLLGPASDLRSRTRSASPAAPRRRWSIGAGRQYWSAFLNFLCFHSGISQYQTREGRRKKGESNLEVSTVTEVIIVCVCFVIFSCHCCIGDLCVLSASLCDVVCGVSEGPVQV
jgi:hypothetical protein